MLLLLLVPLLLGRFRVEQLNTFVLSWHPNFLVSASRWVGPSSVLIAGTVPTMLHVGYWMSIKHWRVSVVIILFPVGIVRD